MKKKTSENVFLMKFTNLNLMELPTPSNISYWWNFGSLLGFTLMIQIISGLFISMHYISSVDEAFNSTIFFTRNNLMGWLMRLTHANGASMFFIFIYLHIGRGIFFQSFKKKETWLSGIIILFILMAIAFIGYVLVWGQMSFWGATVITNLLSAIPYLGEYVVNWIWGGFSVDMPTLNRFYSFHFLMPFILSAVIMIHIASLHAKGSSNPLGLNSNMDKIMFNPLFSIKDLLAPSIIFSIFMMIIFKSPMILGDPENFNPANPMVTPIHIQPEWYFLFAYAILRAIPSKLGGVIALVMSIILLSVLTQKKTLMSSKKFFPFMKLNAWLFFSMFLMLTWLGAKPMEAPFMSMSKLFGTLYFLFLILL